MVSNRMVQEPKLLGQWETTKPSDYIRPLADALENSDSPKRPCRRRLSLRVQACTAHSSESLSGVKPQRLWTALRPSARHSIPPSPTFSLPSISRRNCGVHGVGVKPTNPTVKVIWKLADALETQPSVLLGIAEGVLGEG